MYNTEPSQYNIYIKHKNVLVLFFLCKVFFIVMMFEVEIVYQRYPMSSSFFIYRSKIRKEKTQIYTKHSHYSISISQVMCNYYLFLNNKRFIPFCVHTYTKFVSPMKKKHRSDIDTLVCNNLLPIFEGQQKVRLFG